MRWTDNGPAVAVPDGVLDEGTEGFLKSVWDTMKVFTGIQLSNSTHAPGEPWTIVSDALGTKGKPVIPNDLIAHIFKKKLEAASANSAT